MRILSYFLFALTLGGVILSILFYLYVLGNSCAYAVSSSDCPLRYPWELGREDLLYLFLIPWGVVLLLLAGAIGLYRKSR